MAENPLPEPLLALAARYGVEPDFWDFEGGHRQVSEETLVAILAALGVDASTPERVELALTNAEDEVWRRMLPPVVVSLPFKLIFFVLVDGWYLVAGSLVRSFVSG